MIGVGLVGAFFYFLLSSHYLAGIIGRTLGPYSDAISEHGFAAGDPEVWRMMAARHGVTIHVEPVGGSGFAFDDHGKPMPVDSLPRGHSSIRAVRTARDGTRATLYWMPGSFAENHLSLLVGLLVMLGAVVTSAFWFLQRQIRPLAGLHTGVEAVTRGDFDIRVPVVRDDEIGRMAGALNVMASRVGEMIEDRERLLADVSHELRSPLARMKVALEFMPPGDKRDSLAGDMKEMESLIAVLLEREALRSRAGRLEAEEIDLTEITGEVVSTFSGRKPEALYRPNGPMPVRADPVLMRLLIKNLIDNAVKFSRPDSAPVTVSLERSGDKVVLRVADDGIGIPPGSGKKIFEPFVKLDRSRGHGVGYGVGLNLCQRIVRLHGGTIRLDGRNPRGTEAVVTLDRGKL